MKFTISLVTFLSFLTLIKAAPITSNELLDSDLVARSSNLELRAYCKNGKRNNKRSPCNDLIGSNSGGSGVFGTLFGGSGNGSKGFGGGDGDEDKDDENTK
ncbi:hypothetical protein BJ944DRAFT_273174 [Cunninghamella echinulata]|nr:hypothetical protein BJ944DRAFT_273174 [Cunninghamella echinulata]